MQPTAEIVVDCQRRCHMNVSAAHDVGNQASFLA